MTQKVKYMIQMTLKQPCSQYEPNPSYYKPKYTVRHLIMFFLLPV